MKNKMSHSFNNPDYDLEDFPFYWISRVNGRYLKAMEESLKALDLDNTRRRVLVTLSKRDNVSVSDIVDHTIMKISTVTKIVYRLKDEGLVDTYSCPDDARITRVHLTEKGAAIVVQVNDASHRVLSNSFEGLTKAQLLRLNTMLMTIFHNLPE
ncbi:MAG: MarR family transcriptional regulator [Neisseriaceae bacterium]|nr:MarR family transcriptional regulator [Neisseriaceae bacterium]